MAEDHLQHPLTLFSQDLHSNHKTKKQQSWGIGLSNKHVKKDFQGSWGSSSEKVKDTLKILTAVIKRCFLFCSHFLNTKIPFSLLLDVIVTLLPALVINNQVISMPRALHNFLWTSDAVRRRASFHSYSSPTLQSFKWSNSIWNFVFKAGCTPQHSSWEALWTPLLREGSSK